MPVTLLGDGLCPGCDAWEALTSDACPAKAGAGMPVQLSQTLPLALAPSQASQGTAFVQKNGRAFMKK